MVNLMAVAIPLYIWPTQNAWKPLYNSISANPNTTFNVVINPNSGPGTGATDQEIVSNVAKLNTYSNVNLFGYVHVEYGKRKASVVQKDIATYASWAKNKAVDIHMDGIFLDEAPDDTKYLNYMKNVQSYVKKTMPKHKLVWTNPGIPIDESFYDYADYVNAYENSYQDWMNGGQKVIPECLRGRSTVMIHDWAGSSSKLKSDTKSIISAGYNATFITTSSGYEDFSTNWEQYVKDVATLVKTTKVKTLPNCHFFEC